MATLPPPFSAPGAPPGLNLPKPCASFGGSPSNWVTFHSLKLQNSDNAKPSSVKKANQHELFAAPAPRHTATPRTASSALHIAVAADHANSVRMKKAT